MRCSCKNTKVMQKYDKTSKRSNTCGLNPWSALSWDTEKGIEIGRVKRRKGEGRGVEGRGREGKKGKRKKAEREEGERGQSVEE